MAGIQTLPISHPFPFLYTPNKHSSTLVPRAADPKQTDRSDAEEASTDITGGSEAAGFDSRLSRVRLKYRSGTGKKAELRRAKKNSKKTFNAGSNNASGGGAMMLPPASLKKPVSAVTGGKVEAGFTQYSEKMNGAVAGLGLVALVLVELGSGRGLFKYHAGPTIIIQLYTVAALAAVFIKYEKERSSVWPKKPSPEVSATPEDE
ncbi:hypothetical protein ZOSMA_80G00370 [Zostera marina]|uniref:FKBP-type peptidyl-prolyl cis-trans isomerase n=1 Tax=Zostera marina TaxID=29655 RepID=A0A0K9NPN3_ZOSMR|nr:hypothetical protein ZOSMA_80G00370 [Zostera marina]